MSLEHALDRTDPVPMLRVVYLSDKVDLERRWETGYQSVGEAPEKGCVRQYSLLDQSLLDFPAPFLIFSFIGKHYLPAD